MFLCTSTYFLIIKAMASKEEYEDEDGGGTGRDKDRTPKGMKTSRRGVLALVSLLENHAGLTEVDLFNMDIGDYGAVALGKVKRRPETLFFVTSHVYAYDFFVYCLSCLLDKRCRSY